MLLSYYITNYRILINNNHDLNIKSLEHIDIKEIHRKQNKHFYSQTTYLVLINSFKNF